MDFFLNSEYIDHDRRIELISLGVVAADGREFYAISTEFDADGANDFVRTMVLPLLEPVGHPAWMTRSAMREALLAFIGEDAPRFWSYGSAPWDWLAMAQLLPLDERVPDGWTYTAYDVSCLVELIGLDLDEARLPAPPANQHHTLSDARWARDTYEFLLSAGHSTGGRDGARVTTDFVVDAEFIEHDHEIDLVSLAVISDDGRELYAISTEFGPSAANEFVRTTVLPQLETRDSPRWMSRQQIKSELLAFVGDAVPRFWSWGGLPYDWMVIAQLFGVEERMPTGWLYTGYDITLLVDRAGFSVDPLDERLPQFAGSDAHHALADARWAQSVMRAVDGQPARADVRALHAGVRERRV